MTNCNMEQYINIAVTGWIDYKKAEEMREALAGISVIQGTVSDWNSFIRQYEQRAHPYFEALRAEIVSRDIRITWISICSDH